MTTREPTPLLTRGWDTKVRRSVRDWAWQLGIGMIQWPWLAKSLYGGRMAEKAALLNRLGLPDDALPNLGSWKADAGMLGRIVDWIGLVRPQTMVELGAGASTLVAAKALALAGNGRLISYDQHADFVEETRKWVASYGLATDIRHAPLVSATGEWRDLWYDLHDLPDKIDMLLIDGPPWTIHPLIRSQTHALFNRITRGGVILLDDAARPGERIIAHRWKRDWPDFDWRFVGGIKGTLIGVRR
jgi:hypothetical protein